MARARSRRWFAHLVVSASTVPLVLGTASWTSLTALETGRLWLSSDASLLKDLARTAAQALAGHFCLEPRRNNRFQTDAGIAARTKGAEQRLPHQRHGIQSDRQQCTEHYACDGDPGCRWRKNTAWTCGALHGRRGSHSLGWRAGCTHGVDRELWCWWCLQLSPTLPRARFGTVRPWRVVARAVPAWTASARSLRAVGGTDGQSASRWRVPTHLLRGTSL